MNYRLRILTTFTIVFCCHPGIGSADFALNMNQGGQISTAVADSNHGWEFNVSEILNVTELGLYDHMNDGFLDIHEIGIFRESDSQLLTSGILSPGVGDTLIDNFRYVSVPSVTLIPNVNYVVSFHSTIDMGDFMVTNNPVDLTFHPSINYIDSRWGSVGNGFAMPENTSGGGSVPDRFGPNFGFRPVPEPGATGVLLAALSGIVYRRKR